MVHRLLYNTDTKGVDCTMKKYLEYYLKDERFADLYNNGNARVRKYLRLVFEKSYSLFVLHEGKRRCSFYAALDKAKAALTEDDYTYLVKYAYGDWIPLETKIANLKNGTGDGDSENDTVDQLLQEWHIPKNARSLKDTQLPRALQEWLEMARKDFLTVQPRDGSWYLKYVRITFLFDDIWYIVSPSVLGINEFTFEHYADGIMLSLQSYGARFTRYEGMID